MRLLFIRHGQSVNNLLYDQTGCSNGRNEDPELSPVGKKQVKALAKFLKSSKLPKKVVSGAGFYLNDFSITHLYTSLMVRAVSTAEPVAEVLGLPLYSDMDLHEGGGIYQEEETGEKRGLPGKTRSYFQQHFPRLIIPDGVSESGWWNKPFEEEGERVVRATRLLTRILEKHLNSEDCVAFFSHGEFYNIFLSVLLGLQWRNQFWFLLNNCGISRIDFDKDDSRFVYFNRTDHLPINMIT